MGVSIHEIDTMQEMKDMKGKEDRLFEPHYWRSLAPQLHVMQPRSETDSEAKRDELHVSTAAEYSRRMRVEGHFVLPPKYTGWGQGSSPVKIDALAEGVLV